MMYAHAACPQPLRPPPASHTTALPHAVESGTAHYKDYRSDDPDLVREISLDPFFPVEGCIGGKNKDVLELQLLKVYLLRAYVQYLAEDEAVAKRFDGITLRKLSDMYGFSVVAVHKGMKNIFWRVSGGKDAMGVWVGSEVRKALRAEAKERGLTGQGEMVSHAFACRDGWPPTNAHDAHKQELTRTRPLVHSPFHTHASQPAADADEDDDADAEVSEEEDDEVDAGGVTSERHLRDRLLEIHSGRQAQLESM
jgi:hypothetical protein